jgi:glycogen debranching enzyme
MMRLFDRDDKFGGEYVCPTISRDDPAYPAQGYWRGTIWGPTNYLFYQGLRRYGGDPERRAFARKSVALFMKNWNKDGTCHENFNGITGWGRSDPHYTWGALLCLIGLEELCDFEPNGQLRINGASGITAHVQNLLLLGKKYDLRLWPKKAVLSLNGKTIAIATGRPKYIRL